MVLIRKKTSALIATSFLFLASVASASAPDFSGLERIAARSLQRNIIELPSGSYLVAGQNQFKTLWTRDFCFSTRGLLALGRADVVRSHLTTLIRNRRGSDALVPRVIDSIAPRWRVIGSSLGWSPEFRDPLKPEYQDEHGTEAIDSNILVLMASLDYRDATGDLAWWKEQTPALKEIYRFYENRRDSSTGWIKQGAFSDWQDSVRREGQAFYTNYLFAWITSRLASDSEFEIPAERVERDRQALIRDFFDTESGIFRSLLSQPYFSLESNLLAIESGYFRSIPGFEDALYKNLRRHPLWTSKIGMPGIATWPEYPRSWRSTTVQVARLDHYHDGVYWSWLMALSAKIAHQMGEDTESDRIADALAQAIARDGAVTEIYADNPSLPAWRSYLYRSETPFSWGSAFVLDFARARASVSPTR